MTYDKVSIDQMYWKFYTHPLKRGLKFKKPTVILYYWKNSTSAVTSMKYTTATLKRTYELVHRTRVLVVHPFYKVKFLRQLHTTCLMSWRLVWICIRGRQFYQQRHSLQIYTRSTLVCTSKSIVTHATVTLIKTIPCRCIHTDDFIFDYKI